MQQINDADRPPENDNDQIDGGERLTKRDVIGGATLILVIAAAGSGYYAFNYINKDSLRMQFWISFMFSFAAMIVVVIQVAIYWQQAEFMKQQARSGRQLIELMAISECAYIRVGDLKLPQPIRNNQLVIEGKFFNGGRTPAWNFQRQIQVALANAAPPPPDWGVDWGDSDEAGPISMIVAGGAADFGVGIDVTADILKQINRDEVLILLDGECRYLDSLGGKMIYRFGYTFELEPPRAVERYQTHRREEANPN